MSKQSFTKLLDKAITPRGPKGSETKARRGGYSGTQTRSRRKPGAASKRSGGSR